MKYAANKKILKNKNPGDLAWEAIEPIWDDLPYSSASRLEAFMADLSEGQKALISIDWCQKEIRNGGMGQLFANSTGNLVPYAIPGFRLIGAAPYAELLADAAGLLGAEYPQSGAARKNALKSLNKAQVKQLEKLEDAFLDLIDSTDHDIEQYRGGYVRNNPAEFIGG